MERDQVVGYCRVSTQEQAVGGSSMDSQEAQIRAYCLLNNLDLIEIYKDPGISGTKPLETRPGGKEMSKRLFVGDVKGVVFCKLDRGFRNSIDCDLTCDKWESSGIFCHFIDLGGVSVDGRTPMGRFMRKIIASTAELERGLINERCRIGREARKAQGKLTGTIPFGFRVDKDNYLIPDEDEQAIISEVKALHSQGATSNRIATILNQRSIPTKNGTGKWHCKQIQRILKVAA